MVNTTIRVRADNDLPACAHALVQVHASDGYPVEGVADPVAWLTPPGLLSSWVAEVDGAVVGHVSVSEPRGEDAVTKWIEQASVTEAEVAVLGRLFVLSQARGHSLGEGLTRAAMAHGYEVGRRLVLDVMKKDRAATRLYERLGWRRIGTTTHTFNGAAGVPAYCYVSPQNPHLRT